MMILAAGATSIAAGPRPGGSGNDVRDDRTKAPATAKFALVRSADREEGIRRVIDLLGHNPVKGKEVLLKPNFNTADAYPGSTHNDTPGHLILRLRSLGARTITIGERSGPPDTADVLEEK